MSDFPAKYELLAAYNKLLNTHSEMLHSNFDGAWSQEMFDARLAPFFDVIHTHFIAHVGGGDTRGYSFEIFEEPDVSLDGVKGFNLILIENSEVSDVEFHNSTRNASDLAEQLASDLCN